MKNLKTLLAVAALTCSTAFPEVAGTLEIDFDNGANWNSKVSAGNVKLVGSASGTAITLGAAAAVDADKVIELNVGQANISQSGYVSGTGYLQLDATTQLNITAAITADPISMQGAATISNSANAYTLSVLKGTGLATLSGTAQVTLGDLSANSGGVSASAPVKIDDYTKYAAADSTFTGIASATKAPAAASANNLTFGQITASYNVAANDFISSTGVTGGKVLKASKLVLGSNSWAAAVTAV